MVIDRKLVAPPPFQLGVTAADVLARLATGEAVPDNVAAPVGICIPETRRHAPRID